MPMPRQHKYSLLYYGPMKDAAIGIVLDAKRQSVLLVQRRDVPVWVLPGGGIDLNETPEQAVIREVGEETGLHVVIKRKCAEYLPINRFTSKAYLFECQVLAGEPKPGDEEIACAFFPLGELPKPFFAYHADWLHKALTGGEGCIQRRMSKRTFLRICLTYCIRPWSAFRYLCTRLGFPINS